MPEGRWIAAAPTTPEGMRKPLEKVISLVEMCQVSIVSCDCMKSAATRLLATMRVQICGCGLVLIVSMGQMFLSCLGEVFQSQSFGVESTVKAVLVGLAGHAKCFSGQGGCQVGVRKGEKVG